MTQVPSALTQPVPQPGGPRGAQACGRLPPTRSPKPADAGRLGRLEPALALTPRVTSGAGLCPPSPFPYSSRTVSVPEGRQEET